MPPFTPQHFAPAATILALALSCATAIAADRAATAAPSTPNVLSVPANPEAGTRAAERKLLATVRRAIVRDKALSTSAHNVKLDARAGAITLRGDVRDAAEKSKVEAIVRSVAGVTDVESNLKLQTADAARTPKAPPEVRENTRADATVKPEKSR